MLDQQTGAVRTIHTIAKFVGGAGGIWNKVVLDPASGSVIADTGNGDQRESETQAVIVMDWDTLKTRTNSVWRPAVKEQIDDSDFGASCLAIASTEKHSSTIICHNKNRYMYCLTYSVQHGLTLEWELQMGNGVQGQSPDVSSGVFDGKAVYFATSDTLVQGISYPGSIYAIDPTSGTVLWTAALPGYSLASLAGANDVLVVGQIISGQGATDKGAISILSTKTGKVLYEYDLPVPVYATPTIANGSIYVPTFDGHVYVFSIPALY